MSAQKKQKVEPPAVPPALPSKPLPKPVGSAVNKAPSSSLPKPVGSAVAGRTLRSCLVQNLKEGLKQWSLVCKLTKKWDPKEFKNGESKMASLDVVDKSGASIRVIMWNKAVDKFWGSASVGKTYCITDADVKKSRQGELQIVLQLASRLAPDAASAFPTVERSEQASTSPSDFPSSVPTSQICKTTTPAKKIAPVKKVAEIKFNSLTHAADLEPEASVNTMGVVMRVEERQEFTSRAGKKMSKQLILLTDESSTRLGVTVWNPLRPLMCAEGAVFAARAAKMSEYQGTRSLSANPSSVSFDGGSAAAVVPSKTTSGCGQQDVTHTRFVQLQKWAAETRNQMLLSSRDENRGNLGALPDTGKVEILGCISFFPTDMEKPPWYLSCTQCLRKAQTSPADDNSWECAACGITFSEPKPRYKLHFVLIDATGSRWVGAFQPAAQKLLGGLPAEDLLECIQQQDQQGFSARLSNCLFRTLLLTLEAKPSMSDGFKPNWNVIGVAEPSYADESRALIAALDSAPS